VADALVQMFRFEDSTQPINHPSSSLCSEIPSTQQRFNSNTDETQRASPHYRKVILVGHNIKPELNAMRQLQLNMKHQGTVVGVLDTWKIAQQAFPWQSQTLQNILKALGCPVEEQHFHNGGNDAYFALTALVMLWCRAQTVECSQLSYLQTIGQALLTNVKKRQERAISERNARMVLDREDSMSGFEIGSDAMF
jgi:DNA polymerase III alpha subunit (gram-positive type)